MKDYLLAALRTNKKIPQSLVEEGYYITNGLVIPRAANFSDNELLKIVTSVIPELVKFSETFHKSWETIINTPQEELWTQAVLHYFTTYGLESMGIDNEGYIYIPEEISDIPTLRKLRVIEPIDDTELCETVVKILESGIALDQTTINDYVTILEHNNYSIDTEEIRNRDVRTLFQYKSKSIPEDRDQLIRLLNYTLTRSLTLVKNDNLFYSIKNIYRLDEEDKKLIDRIFEERSEQLAKMFRRYKQIFCGLRYQGYKKQVNKIRRMSNKLWEPKIGYSYLSTRILNPDINVDFKEFEQCSVYDLAKIYNKLNYICQATIANNCYHDVVVIRNGKVFVDPTPKTITKEQFGWAVAAKEQILNVIKDKLFDKVDGIILPEGMDIAFPTSEKSFIGDIPLYTQIKTDASSVIGIAWDNFDLDLSALLPDGGKVGWNSYYSNATKDILYSGDQTRGGAEALFFNSEQSALVMLNRYYGDIKEANLFISNEKEFSLKTDDKNWASHKTYLYDPNNIIYTVKVGIEAGQQTLGVYDKQNNQTVFTFATLGAGDSNVSTNNETSAVLLECLKLRGNSALKLKDVFQEYTKEELEDLEEQTKLEDLDKDIVDLNDLSKNAILELTTTSDLLKTN